MNNWLGRGILFLVVGLGGILSLHYTTSHFKPDRQLLLLNRTRPDFHHFFNIEKQESTGLSKSSLKEYFDYFNLVTEALPENSDGMLMLGYLDEITGNKKQAEVLFKEAYRLDPQFFFTGFNLALVFFEQGEYDQSMDLLQKTLAIPPQLTLRRMADSVIYRQIFASMDDSHDIITGLQRAYQDAYILLTQAKAHSSHFQKELQKADDSPQVHAHIM